MTQSHHIHPSSTISLSGKKNEKLTYHSLAVHISYLFLFNIDPCLA